MAVIGDREPATSREAEVIGAIRAAFSPGNEYAVRITGRATDRTGRALADRFVTRLEIKAALKRLPMRQMIVLFERFGQDKNTTETARKLSLSYNTVATDEAAGLQGMVRILWDEPSYESSPRMRRVDRVAEFLASVRRGRRTA